jgi:hypothetical protein
MFRINQNLKEKERVKINNFIITKYLESLIQKNIEKNKIPEKLNMKKRIFLRGKHYDSTFWKI